jgi:hypothetical protein
MHCELIVPGLFGGQAGARLRALELLLARGRVARSEAQPLEDWLHDVFELDATALPAGALTLLGSKGDPGEACWARTDPVHLRLMRDRLIVVPSAAFAVSQEEAAALCEALNRHFAGVLALNAVQPHRWCARLEREIPVQACAPLEVAGRDVALTLPDGAAGKRWQSLCNEAQMLLHAHPVNEAREARGEPAINSLWLWGVGRAPRAAPGRWQSLAADDPVALGLARLSGARPRPLPESAGAWLERAPQDGRHLAVLDALRAPLALGHAAEYEETLAALERGWFGPLLAALRAGRIGMLTVHVPDGGAAFETIRGDLRRFWRRPRAIERYA